MAGGFIPFNKKAPNKTPGLNTGSRGRSTNQMPGLFRNSHAGNCQECGLRIPSGNFVSAGRNGGMVHPRCIGKNNASSTGTSKTSKATKKPHPVKKIQQPKPAPVPVPEEEAEEWIRKTIDKKKHLWNPSNNHCYRCEADGSQGEWAGLYNPKSNKIDDSVEEPVDFETE